jgi:PKD repeat protein
MSAASPTRGYELGMRAIALKLPTARAGRRQSLGQSLVEFALILPVILLLTLMAIDFGRVYLGWVNLQNMARVASNYAANHPTAWALDDATLKAEYQSQIRADAKASNCSLPLVGGVETAPDPVFTPDTNIGGQAEVRLSCTFRILTPVIGNLVGSGGNLTVSAAAIFPIKSGQFATGGGGSPTAPVANFTGSPTTITDGSSVAFTDTSTGAPDTWAWDFGDGGTATVQNPVHPYTLTDPLVAQTFTVSLTASNSVGSDTRTRTAYITVNPIPPGADFTWSPSSGDRPLTVVFTDTSSGSPTAWSWNFGDGVNTTTQNPSHTYSTAGTYSVTLTVTGPSGTSSVTKPNIITVEVGSCTVPNFVGTSTTTAQATWEAFPPPPSGGGFTTNVNFQQGNLPWTIKSQSLTGGSLVPCDSNITLSKN